MNRALMMDNTFNISVSEIFPMTPHRTPLTTLEKQWCGGRQIIIHMKFLPILVKNRLNHLKIVVVNIIS